MKRESLAALIVLIFLSGCSQEKEDRDERKAPGMKCGAGKCGANMFDGNSALAKKKKNILSQMRDDDARKECVIAAKTTKAAYDCIRDPKGKKLILKCGANKGGDSIHAPLPSKKEPPMKCGAGKCGSSM